MHRSPSQPIQDSDPISWRITAALPHKEQNHHGGEPMSLMGLCVTQLGGTEQRCRITFPAITQSPHKHPRHQPQHINCCTPSMQSSFLPPNTLSSAYNGPPAFSPWQTILVLWYSVVHHFLPLSLPGNHPCLNTRLWALWRWARKVTGLEERRSSIYCGQTR